MTGQGEGGAVLGEEARDALRDAIGPAFTHVTGRLGHHAVDVLVDAAALVVVALVDQARADGAAEERERIAKAIEAVDGQPAQAWRGKPLTLRTQEYLGGFSDGLAEAADVARRSP